jgi:four helix bundle protein
VWQKAHALALKSIKATNSVKRSYASDIIVKQLIRAATSIGANIAEGCGRNEGKEYVRFLQISFGSANEVDNWLNLLKDAELLPSSTASELLDLNIEIQKMLVSLIKRIKEKGNISKEKGKSKLTPNP